MVRPIMIDHLTLRVPDVRRSIEFYRAALAPLGYELLREMEFPGMGLVAAFGKAPKPTLWLAPATADHITPTGQHLALKAENRAQVDAFHAAALAAGARDDGAPGLRAEYHPSYYGAFVVDLNGVHLEACTHRPE